MNIAIVSDTHFGDPMSTLFKKDDAGEIVKGSKYTQFREAVGQNNDYLILLGDIIDLSIESYKNAFDVAKGFFLQIKNDNIAKEIIYIPGNHDFDIWHTCENQINIIHQIQTGRPPTHFRWSVPGVIDDRTGSDNRGFTIPGVSKRTDGKGHAYGGLFLDDITRPQAEETVFNFVYPNLYLVSDNESVLITHGHYLETFWITTGEWVLKIAAEDLKAGHTLDLKNMVAVNFPLCQLSCSGIGQAGQLTKLIRQVQRNVKDKELNKVEIYLDRFIEEIDKLTRFPWYGEIIETIISKKVKSAVLKSLRQMEYTRFSEEFINKQEVRDQFWNYYQASMIEINDINRKYKFDIPMPWYFIFGHTHRPIKWGDKTAPKTAPLGVTNMMPITMYNTGGWLNHRNEQGEIEFCGAAVFKYETGKGFWSVSVE